MDEMKKQLNRIETSTRRTEQAVFGDEAIGLTGLVNDVKGMKSDRQKAAVKAAGIGGVVAGAIMGGKALLTALLGGK